MTGVPNTVPEINHKQVPEFLKAQAVFKTNTGTLSADKEYNLYVVRAYSEVIAAVSLLSGEVTFAQEPTHQQRRKHWQIVKDHLVPRIGLGEPPSAIIAINRARYNRTRKRSQLRYAANRPPRRSALVLDNFFPPADTYNTHPVR